MAKPVSNIDAEKLLACLFPVDEVPVDEGSLCPKDIVLLIAFAEARSANSTLLKSIDFVDVRSSGCAGIGERDVFPEHSGSFERYDA
jgi:hypothetical protein